MRDGSIEPEKGVPNVPEGLDVWVDVPGVATGPFGLEESGLDCEN
jgi:hypothetical protein